MDRFIDRLYSGRATLIELRTDDLECLIEHDKTIRKHKENVIIDLDAEGRIALDILEHEIAKLSIGDDRNAFYKGYKFGTELGIKSESICDESVKNIEITEVKIKYLKPLYADRMNNNKSYAELGSSKAFKKIEKNFRDIALEGLSEEHRLKLNEIEDAVVELILNDHEEAFYIGLKFGSQIANEIIRKEGGEK